MKKLIAGVLFIFPLVAYATPAPNDIVRGVAKVAKGAKGSTSAWRGLPEAMKKSLEVLNASGVENLEAFQTSIDKDFELRESVVEQNTDSFEEMLALAEFSPSWEDFSPVLPDTLFGRFVISDIYGPKPANEFFTPPVYSHGVRPFVVTKKPLYVKLSYSEGGGILEIPAKSTIQVEGRLTEDDGEPVITSFVEFVKRALDNPEIPSLRKQAGNRWLGKELELKPQHIEELLLSPYADRLFSQVFLSRGRGGRIVPTVVTKIPLTIARPTGSPIVHPAGSFVQLNFLQDNSSGVMKGWSPMMGSSGWSKTVNDKPFPIMELFDGEKMPDGSYIYRPKTFMYWDDGGEDPYIIGPQDTFRAVWKEGEKVLKPISKLTMKEKDFRKSVEIPVPDAATLLDKLPNATPDMVYSAQKVEPIVENGDGFESLEDVKRALAPGGIAYDTLAGGFWVRRDASTAESERPHKAKRALRPSVRPSNVNDSNTPPPVTKVQKVEPKTQKKPSVMPAQEEIYLLIAKGQIAPVSKRMKFKYFNARYHKGPNEYHMYEVLYDNVELSSGRVANRTDYLCPKDDKIVVYKASDVKSSFTPMGK